MIEKREIWFRGKSSATKQWVEGYFYKKKFYRSDAALCSYITVPHPGLNRRPSDNILVIPETVGQYIGLTDMNGKKIFEGDIVKRFWLGMEIIYKITYESKHTCFIGKAINTSGFTTFNNDGKEYEIIGNIYDNPKLLKEGT